MIISLRAWWRALDTTWKRIFKLALDINHTPTDVELQQIAELEAVDCSGKRIISLEPLEQLVGLRRLDAHNTRISRLERISKLHLLDELDISGTDVSSLEPLECLSNLWAIRCVGCPIASLNGLEKLVNLAHLDCSGTAVTTLEPVSLLPELRAIKANASLLSDEASIAVLEAAGVILQYEETPLLAARHLAKQQLEAEFTEAERDSLFEEAARCVVLHQQGSTSLIQRKLKLGYNRAGRVMEQLEKVGVVGPFEGSIARKVLIPDEYQLAQLLSGKASGQLTPFPTNKPAAIYASTVVTVVPLLASEVPSQDVELKKTTGSGGWLRKLFS